MRKKGRIEKEPWNIGKGNPEIRSGRDLDNIDRRLKGLLGQFANLPVVLQRSFLESMSHFKSEADRDPGAAIREARQLIKVYEDSLKEIEISREEEIRKKSRDTSGVRPTVEINNEESPRGKDNEFGKLLEVIREYADLEEKIEQQGERKPKSRTRGDDWYVRDETNRPKKPSPRGDGRSIKGNQG